MKSRNLIPLVKLPAQRPHATVRQLRRQVSERRLGYYKLDGKIFIDLDEYDAYVERGRVDPT
jgi:hypothetical protein